MSSHACTSADVGNITLSLTAPQGKLLTHLIHKAPIRLKCGAALSAGKYTGQTAKLAWREIQEVLEAAQAGSGTVAVSLPLGEETGVDLEKCTDEELAAILAKHKSQTEALEDELEIRKEVKLIKDATEVERERLRAEAESIKQLIEDLKKKQDDLDRKRDTFRSDEWLMKDRGRNMRKIAMETVEQRKRKFEAKFEEEEKVKKVKM